MSTAPPVYGLDSLTQLSHALIRSGARDTLDPFMIPVIPSCSHDDLTVRGCFYYAVAITPQHTVLFDNWGEGGMCKLALHEMRAVWDTSTLLAAVGLSLDELKAGHAVLPSIALPAPDEIINDFDPSSKTVEHLVDPPYCDWYGKRVSLRGLLKSDKALQNLMLEAILEQAPLPAIERLLKRLEARAQEAVASPVASPSRSGPRPG